jgi:cytochrome P450
MYAKWTKEFGSVYGYFEGHQPILVTSDLEIINEVFVKQYITNFAARKLPQGIRSDDDPNMFLMFTSKYRWKRMRNIINPTFSPAKLKEVKNLILSFTFF